MIKQNPYLDRVAIRDIHRFYGRRREVTRIFSRLGAARPQSISIVGERRIGKSSLLNYIAHPEIQRNYLEDHGRFVFIKMDLQERKNLSLQDFLRELILLLLQAVDFSEALTPDFEGFRIAVASLQKKNRKVIVLFDEFDVVTTNPLFGEDFFSFFRSLANNYDLAYVTSSMRDLQELCHTSKIADSPFFNIFSTLNLSGFTREEALELIGGPSERAGIPLLPYAGQIMELGGLLPFFLQIASGAYFEHLLLGSGPVDHDACRESFLEEARPHFNYIWEHLTNEEKEILHLVRRKEAVHPSLSHAQKKLEKNGYLLPARGSDPLRLFSGVLGEFLETREQERLSDEMETLQVQVSLETAKAFFEKSDPTHPDSVRPDRLGSFQIVRKLGEGGMGIVYKATDLNLNRPVAIKVISPQMLGNTSMHRRFLREARSASALNHPNICTIYQVGQESGLDYIVMEFLEGETLRDALKRGAFSPARLARVGVQAADALHHAHSRGMVHRDIKPANIMVTSEGRVKILDFGLAKCTTPRPDQQTDATGLTEQGAIMGTVNYMSPEQLRGDAIDHRTDIFSFGIVLYELAFGHSPFQDENYIGTMHAILYHPPAPPPQDFPAELWAVIGRALEKDLERRSHSAAEIRDGLAQFLKEGYPAEEGR